MCIPHCFLALNGWSLLAGDADCVMAVLRLAGGELSGAQFAEWVRANSSRD